MSSILWKHLASPHCMVKTYPDSDLSVRYYHDGWSGTYFVMNKDWIVKTFRGSRAAQDFAISILFSSIVETYPDSDVSIRYYPYSWPKSYFVTKGDRIFQTFTEQEAQELAIRFCQQSKDI